MPDPRATAIADSLPVTDAAADYREGDKERIPLQDIVVTAIEHHEFNHFRVRKYDPDADGVEREWAIVEGLPSAYVMQGHLPKNRGRLLDAASVRKGVELYLDDRLSKGMPEEEAQKMVDGVYTDVLVCDSIVQFILYGEEVFG